MYIIFYDCDNQSIVESETILLLLPFLCWVKQITKEQLKEGVATPLTPPGPGSASDEFFHNFQSFLVLLSPFKHLQTYLIAMTTMVAIATMKAMTSSK